MRNTSCAAPLAVLLTAASYGQQFSNPTPIFGAVPVNLMDVAVGDVDGDGDPDVLSGHGDDHTVYLYENLGSGEFGGPRLVTDRATQMTALHLADLDGDGDDDVVVTLRNLDAIAWFESNGDGSFGPRRIAGDGMDYPIDVISGDLDGDGRVDLVACGYASNFVEWWRNLGGGMFAPGGARVGVMGNPLTLATGDADGDGDLDVVFGGGTGNSGRMELACNTGGGAGWTSGSTLSFATTWDVAFDDLNGDGFDDIGQAGTDGFRVYLTSASGPQQSITVPKFPGSARAIDFADLDGDGDRDILLGTAVTAVGVGGLSWVRNAGSGIFDGPFALQQPTAFGFTTTCDLDGNGTLDPLWWSPYGGEAVEWVPNLIGGTFAASRPITGNVTGAVQVETFLDADGDGDPDLVVSRPQHSRMWWFENAGGSFGTLPTVLGLTLGSPGEVESGDVDGDGDLDLLVFGDSLHWFENKETGSFTRRLPPLSNGIDHGGIADVDSDGVPDIVGGRYNTADILCWRGLGGGGFAAPIPVAGPLQYGLGRVALADLDGDGDPEIVATQPSEDTIVAFENLGSFTFGPPRIVVPAPWGPSAPGALQLAELNGDGHLDLIFDPSIGSAVSWALGDGSGGFGPVQSAPSGSSGDWYDMALTDVDLDGRLDAVFAGFSFSQDGVRWCRNLGGGSFAAGEPINLDLNGSTSLIAADHDGDGDEDLWVGSYQYSYVMLLKNEAASPSSMGVSYCGPAVPNASGQDAKMRLSGVLWADRNDVTLIAENLPTQTFGYFLASRDEAIVPMAGGSVGTLCLGGNIARVVASLQSSGPAGRFGFGLDLTSVPTSPASSILAGETWSFQAWFRDVQGAPTSNFTDGRRATFQ